MIDAGPEIDVSVIVPTYRDWTALQDCLDALAGQTVEADRFEILVANNNPAVDLPEDLHIPRNARVVWQPKPGS